MTTKLPRHYTPQDRRIIELGFIPDDMNQRWEFRWEAPHLLLIRSWSGETIYKAKFHPASDGGIDLESVEVTDFALQGAEVSETAFDQHVTNCIAIIDQVLLGHF